MTSKKYVVQRNLLLSEDELRMFGEATDELVRRAGDITIPGTSERGRMLIRWSHKQLCPALDVSDIQI